MFTQRQSTSESISQSESGTSNTVRVNDRTEASSSACRLNRVGLLTESRYSTLIFNFVVCFSFTRKQIYLDYPPVSALPPSLSLSPCTHANRYSDTSSEWVHSKGIQSGGRCGRETSLALSDELKLPLSCCVCDISNPSNELLYSWIINSVLISKNIFSFRSSLSLELQGLGKDR